MRPTFTGKGKEIFDSLSKFYDEQKEIPMETGERINFFAAVELERQWRVICNLPFNDLENLILSLMASDEVMREAIRSACIKHSFQMLFATAESSHPETTKN